MAVGRTRRHRQAFPFLKEKLEHLTPAITVRPAGNVLPRCSTRCSSCITSSKNPINGALPSDRLLTEKRPGSIGYRAFSQSNQITACTTLCIHRVHLGKLVPKSWVNAYQSKHDFLVAVCTSELNGSGSVTLPRFDPPCFIVAFVGQFLLQF